MAQDSSTDRRAGNAPRIIGDSRELPLSRGLLRLLRKGRDSIVLIEAPEETDRQDDRPALLLSAATECVKSTRTGIQALIIVPDSDSVQRVAARRPDRTVRVASLGSTENVRAEAAAVLAGSSAYGDDGAAPGSAGPDVVVTTPDRLIDHIRRDNVDISRVAVCVLDPPARESMGQFSADLHYIYTKFDRQPVTVLCEPRAAHGEQPSASLDAIEELMRRPTRVTLTGTTAAPPRPAETLQEQATMPKRDLPFDREATAQQLRDIVRKIHEEEDPEELVQYKRFIKRHVSIFNRAYFTAYLFKQMFQEGGGGSEGRTSIFVSAGRNRRIHARDLVTLFTSADGVTRDDIGQIKVLDNYSFVELDSSKAKQAIEELNGTELRGRKLTINYARKK